MQNDLNSLLQLLSMIIAVTALSIFVPLIALDYYRKSRGNERLFKSYTRMGVTLATIAVAAGLSWPLLNQLSEFRIDRGTPAGVIVAGVLSLQSTMGIIAFIMLLALCLFGKVRGRS